MIKTLQYMSGSCLGSKSTGVLDNNARQNEDKGAFSLLGDRRAFNKQVDTRNKGG